IIELVYATRYPQEFTKLKSEAHFIQYGVSTRACIDLNLAAKALAYIDERDYVLPEDIKDMAVDVFNHRISLSYEAEAEGITRPEIVKRILEQIPLNVEE
ncbi:MAG: ATPase, partial [Bacteroidota bacterium]